MRKINDLNEEYHSSPLVGTSTIVSGYDSTTSTINLAKLNSYLKWALEIPKARQKIFDYGSVQHAIVLEQDTSQLTVVPDFKPIPGITKKDQETEWKEKDHGTDKMPSFKPIPGITVKDQLSKFKESSTTEYYLNQSEYNHILSAFDTISSNTSAAQMISSGIDVETSFYDDDSGLKCRPDIVGENSSGEFYICNYKTIADLNKVHSHIYHLKYDLRAIQEIILVEKFYKRKVDHYFFLFQEKSAPFSLKCIEISGTDLELARTEYEIIKNTVLTAIKENYFPQPELFVEQSNISRKSTTNNF